MPCGSWRLAPEKLDYEMLRNMLDVPTGPHDGAHGSRTSKIISLTTQMHSNGRRKRVPGSPEPHYAMCIRSPAFLRAFAAPTRETRGWPLPRLCNSIRVRVLHVLRASRLERRLARSKKHSGTPCPRCPQVARSRTNAHGRAPRVPLGVLHHVMLLRAVLLGVAAVLLAHAKCRLLAKRRRHALGALRPCGEPWVARNQRVGRHGEGALEGAVAREHPSAPLLGRKTPVATRRQCRYRRSGTPAPR